VTIGVLALQGDYQAHAEILQHLGVRNYPVRAVNDLAGIDGLIIPGGESTVMTRLCDRYGLWEPLQETLRAGLPVLGTCAGMIMLASSITGGAKTFVQRTLGVLDIDVARNAYGAQLDSFEADIPVLALHADIRGVFIRAPKITRRGETVEVLAEWEGAPILVRSGVIMAASFHPEIAGENRVHRLWLESIPSRQTRHS
jgi:5'-phosphate synthase pdxT subunit